MANTAAQLLNLLTANADYNYYSQQLIFWSNKYEANAAKLEEQNKYEAKWENAFGDGMDVDKNINFKNFHKAKGTEWTEAQADAYAHAKVWQWDEELQLELADNDIEYDSMKTMFETLMEKKQSEKEADKQGLATAAQETGLIQS